MQKQSIEFFNDEFRAELQLSIGVEVGEKRHRWARALRVVDNPARLTRTLTDPWLVGRTFHNQMGLIS